MSEDRQPPEHLSALSLLNVLLRQRWLVAVCALGLFAAVVGVGLARDRSYTSSAAFLPQQRRNGNALSGLASQLGLNVPLSDGTQSPQFYVDLLTSREILKSVVVTRFTSQRGRTPAEGTLLELYELGETEPALRREEALRRLRTQIDASVSPKTGVVSLSVTTLDPSLSAQIAERLLELINEFNLSHRQSQASAERRFTERRLAEVAADLRTAEDRLQAFQQQNRDIRAPGLALEQDRRTRAVALQTQLYGTLAEAYEQAKIEEVRDTPVISVLERPEIPVRPAPRGLLLKGLLALFAGAVIGALLAFARDLVTRPGPHRTGEVAEFRMLRRQTVDDITHPWRPIARLVRGHRTSALDGR